VADRKGVTAWVPLSALAKTYMFQPGHPKVPPWAREARIVGREGDALAIQYRGKGKWTQQTARWFQTAPIAPEMKTQSWWTKTGQWGPTVLPESVVGPVAMSRPSGLGSRLLSLLR